MKKEVSRYVVLDLYRYIAAMGVVLFHLNLYVADLHVRYIGNYGDLVDMFFILSGFVMYLTYRDRVRTSGEFRNFIVRRLARIYPLHIVMLVIFVVYVLALQDWHGGTALVSDFLVNAALVQAWGFSRELVFNTPSWSISGEFACYLLYPLVAIAVIRLPLVLGFAGVAVAYIVGAHGHLPFWSNSHSQMYGANIDFGVIRALIGFANGVLLSRLYLRLEWNSKWFLAAGIGSMVLAIVCMNVFPKADLIILLMAVSIVATALGERAFGGAVPRSALWEWFGDTSYAVYMIHWFVIMAFIKPWLEKTEMTQASFFGLCVVLVTGLTVFSHYVYVWFEAPAKRRITRALSSGGALRPVSVVAPVSRFAAAADSAGDAR